METIDKNELIRLAAYFEARAKTEETRPFAADGDPGGAKAEAWFEAARVLRETHQPSAYSSIGEDILEVVAEFVGGNADFAKLDGMGATLVVAVQQEYEGGVQIKPGNNPDDLLTIAEVLLEQAVKWMEDDLSDRRIMDGEDAEMDPAYEAAQQAIDVLQGRELEADLIDKIVALASERHAEELDEPIEPPKDRQH